jgi:hypothetical protein
MVDILNPTELINVLFGSIYLFFACMSLVYFYIASKYRFNVQVTIWLGIIGTMLFGILFEAWTNFIGFIIFFIGTMMSYIFWRYFK